MIRIRPVLPKVSASLRIVWCLLASPAALHPPTT